MTGISDFLYPKFNGPITANDYIEGGVFVRNTTTQRNNIGLLFRLLDATETTLCFVSNENKWYKLVNEPGTDSTSDGDWQQLPSGSGGGSLVYNGPWDLTTNTPTLDDSDGLSDVFYTVTNADGGYNFQSPSLLADEATVLNTGDYIMALDGTWRIFRGDAPYVRQGLLEDDVIINLDSNSNLSFAIQEYGLVDKVSLALFDSDGVVTLNINTLNTSGNQADLNLSQGVINLKSKLDNYQYSTLSFDGPNNRVRFTDNRTSKVGIEYDSITAVGTNFIGTSLINKSYADSRYVVSGGGFWPLTGPAALTSNVTITFFGGTNSTYTNPAVPNNYTLMSHNMIGTGSTFMVNLADKAGTAFYVYGADSSGGFGTYVSQIIAFGGNDELNGAAWELQVFKDFGDSDIRGYAFVFDPDGSLNNPVGATFREQGPSIHGIEFLNYSIDLSIDFTGFSLGTLIPKVYADLTFAPIATSTAYWKTTGFTTLTGATVNTGTNSLSIGTGTLSSKARLLVNTATNNRAAQLTSSNSGSTFGTIKTESDSGTNITVITLTAVSGTVNITGFTIDTSSTGIIVSYEINTTGLYYNADFSTNGVANRGARWIPDKGFNDARYSLSGGTAYTQGSVIFSGASSVLSESNTTFFWDNTNKWLGIGNAVPVGIIHTSNTTSTAIRGVIFEQNSTDTNSSRVYIRKARGTFASPSTILTGDVLSNFTTTGYTNAHINAAEIVVTSTGTISSGIVPAIMTFRTANTSGVMTTALTISQAQIVTLTNPLPIGSGGIGIAFSAPGADTLFGWDNADVAFTAITIGPGLTYDHSTHTLTSTGSGGISIGAAVASGTLGSVLFVGTGVVLAQDPTTFFWDHTNARLGIGNAAPAVKLHVVETAATTPRGVLIDQYSTGTNGARLSLRKARNTFASPTVIVTADALASLTFEGYDGTNFVESSKILVTSTGTIATGKIGSTMQLQTMTTAGALTTAITISETQVVTLANALGTANGGTGVANNAASTITITGAFGTTFTISATTSVTLPTSGTLVTTTQAWLTTGTTTLTGASTIVGTTTNIIKYQFDNLLNSTPTLGAGLWLYNGQAATVGQNQETPSLGFTSSAWKTNATAASQVIDWLLNATTTTGAANPTGTFNIQNQVNGGGFTSIVTITSGGLMTIANATVTSTFKVATIQNTVGNNTVAFTGAWTTTTNQGIFVFSSVGSTLAPTSGILDTLRVGNSGSGFFTVATGSAAYNDIRQIQTINQTGSASGAITMININPTLTSVLGVMRGIYYNPSGSPSSTHRAFEATAGDFVMGTGDVLLGIASSTTGTNRNILASGSNSTVSLTFATKGPASPFYFSTTSGNAVVSPAGSATTLLVNGASGSPSLGVGIGTTGVGGSYAYVGGVVFQAFADTGNGTTVETDLNTYTAPANSLGTNGEKFETEYAGTIVGSATATRQIRVYFGGTVIFNSTAVTYSTNSTWSVKVTIIRVSATVIRYNIQFTFEGTALSSGGAGNVGELTGLTLSSTNILKITGQAASTGALSNDIVLTLAAGKWFPAI